MITISLCMIVKNEEKVLKRCLDSVKAVVDEIIIVDTGSTDRTKEIAESFTGHVYDLAWSGDFSAARNFAFSKAAMDYQMWLDADDVVPEDSVKKLLQLKENLPPETDLVMMKYITHFDQAGNPLMSSTRERLFKREKSYHWEDPVHEYIVPSGIIKYTDIEIHHRKENIGGSSRRNLNIYEELEAKNKVFSPRQLYYFARELKDHGYWFKAVYYFEKFLEQNKGWVEDNIAACFNSAICYKRIGDNKKALSVLIKSFRYDAPRAEICSEIGYIYKQEKNYAQALKWFDLAARLGEPDSNGFILWDYWGYIPNIECCVCCSKIGDFSRALRYNERASRFKETSATRQNRVFLQSQLKI